MPVHYGATDAEWVHFSLVLGLTADLLPVVSRPGAPVSPHSKLKSPGKVPSKYNPAGEVVGLPHWTVITATEAQVEHWSRNHDYGICLQTRHVRAIDIDVDDLGTAAKIRARLAALLGVSLPARARAGVGRVILGCRVVGEPGAALDASHHKRIIRLADGKGIVEYLATGQQFIACGTHTSGARYFWEGGLPADFPAVDAGALQRGLDLIEQEFGDAGDAADGAARLQDRDVRGADHRERGHHRERFGRRAHSSDPVVSFLRERGWTREDGQRGGDQGRAGEIFIICPWVEEHTGDSGETETVYWQADTGGYEKGHFKCLHAHCAHRTDEDFFDAIGWQWRVLPELQEITDEGFEPRATGVARARPPATSVSVAVPAPLEPGAAPGDVVDEDRLPEDPIALWTQGIPGQTLARSRKGFIATMRNVLKALRTQGYWRRLGYDRFRDEIMWCDWRGAGNGQWQRWEDNDYTRARERLEADGFEPVSREMVRDAVWLVAAECEFDSAQLWLKRLQWDGTPRVETFFSQFAGAADNPYTRAVGRYLWTALAGRVLAPGVKADMVPVLVGAGGVRKSSLVEALAPSPRFACRVHFKRTDEDNIRIMRGCVVAEIAELRGLHGRDSEEIKDFLSARHDKWTPKYKEVAVEMGRRLVFVGTTDRDDFLSDNANNLRRWLPLAVTEIDVDAAVALRDQLWAEASARFGQLGVEWQDAQQLAPVEHDDFRFVDDWCELVERWMGQEISLDEQAIEGFEIPPEQAVTWLERGFTSREALTHAIGIPASKVGRADQMRMAAVLREIGLSRRRGSRVGPLGRNARVWSRGVAK